jgi:hypothetical protein
MSVHSPALDFKRIAVSSQIDRLAHGEGSFDFGYLRHDAGRHGILALHALSGTSAPLVAERARSALAEVNRRELGSITPGQMVADGRSLIRSRIEVYPRGRSLPEGLTEHLRAVVEKDRLQLRCIDADPPCAALLIDLDGDGQEEAVVLAPGQATGYARPAGDWARVGRLMSGRYQNPAELRRALEESRWQTPSPSRYHGLEIGSATYAFVPDACESGDVGCP